MLLFLPACPAAIGAGVTLVAGGAAVLAYRCDDSVAIVVSDGATGNRICDATVTATSDGSTEKATPCFSLALGEGTWSMRAEKAGYQPAFSTVVVDHTKGCRADRAPCRAHARAAGRAREHPVHREARAADDDTRARPRDPARPRGHAARAHARTHAARTHHATVTREYVFSVTGSADAPSHAPFPSIGWTSGADPAFGEFPRDALTSAGGEIHRRERRERGGFGNFFFGALCG